MAKITVRHAVAAAYGLLFGRPLTVIGLTWLPALFYAMGAAYLIQRMNIAMAAAVPSAGGLLGQFAFFYFVALLAATALFGALIAVALTRQAFGLREEPVAAHLVLGPREFRLFLALLRYYAIVVVALVVLAFGAGVAITQGTHYAIANGAPAAWLGTPLETWLNSLAGATGVIFLSVCAVRYGFFLDAIAAAEDRTRLRRASALSRGNFWPLAVVSLLAGVPAGLVIIACEMTFGGVAFKGLGFVPADALPSAIVLAVGLVVLHSLFAGASAAAYSELADAVVPESEHHEVPSLLGRSGAFAMHEPAHESGFAAAPAPVRMEIVTPEAHDPAETSPAAEPAQAVAETQTTTGWVAPPPDAHFGLDPHDAQPHEPSGEPEAEHAAGAEEDHQNEAQNAGETVAETPHEVSATACTEAAAVEAHSADVSEHALDAEFPAPPLDPAGAMSAQQGFHTPE